MGNSYTFYNDMPVMVQNMLNANSARCFNYKVDLIAQGGAKIADHVSAGVVLPRIEAGHYYYVFLQDQSTTVLYTNEAIVADAALGTLIRGAKKHGAQVALLSTWARKPGNEFYSGSSYSNFARPANAAAMSRAVNSFYQRVAGRYGANHVLLGAYWFVLLEKHPEIELYTHDGSHPSPAGSYFMALMITRSIAGTVPENVWRTSSVSEADTQVLINFLLR